MSRPPSPRHSWPPDGIYRIGIEGLAQADGETFATALDETLSPIGSPRYLMPRYLIAARPRGSWSRWTAGWRWRHGRSAPNAVIYHAVPAVLASNGKRAQIFATSWSRWVSAGKVVYANTPVGEGILATHRGRSPLDITTALRVSWQ